MMKSYLTALVQPERIMNPMANIQPRSQALPDIQKNVDNRQVALQQAGVKNVRIPLKVMQKDGTLQTVIATVSVSVSLSEAEKGTHMSRFILQLNEWSKHKVLTLQLYEFLQETLERLEAPSARVELSFPYFMEKAAPVSGLSAPFPVDCTIIGSLNQCGDYKLLLGVDLHMATLCPCSKAISEYGAHNQRAEIQARLLVNTETEHPVLWIEDIAKLLDDTASCPVYPLLKRDDEKCYRSRL
jgi:GTP cyclohydrolase I